MQQSDQTLYVARSQVPMPIDELRFHLSQFPAVEAQIRELVARGYSIIGYMADQMMYDLDDRPLPLEGGRELDLVISGPMAYLLMPKQRWRFGDLSPTPTVRELGQRITHQPLVLMN